MSRERTEEEEREYRRYLHRLKRRRERRRKVMIARTIVGVAGVLILLLLVGLIRLGVRTVQGGSSQKNKHAIANAAVRERRSHTMAIAQDFFNSFSFLTAINLTST